MSLAEPIRNLVILGSTGSIGRSTLDVVAASHGRFRVTGLTAHSRVAELASQARAHQPRWVLVTDPAVREQALAESWPAGTTCHVAPDTLPELVAAPDVDVVVSAIVGSAGLHGTWAALDAGKTVALANKETLVMAGPLVMELARRRQAALIPVDSEHSAVFQALQAGRREEVKRIVLTASGGPFRTFSQARIEQATVQDALAHPTWNMGPKITIDSATMMNKALEVIEARWLFDFPTEQIGVVVHPQSIVHSLVEYRDGSVLAQLSPPDMKLPIQYALTYPERREGPAAKLDWASSFRLEFEPPDHERFPALGLGFEVARAGGTAGAVLNAANEAAVAGFLAGRLRFTQIVPACRAALQNHDFDSTPPLSRLIQVDAWAREEVERWIGC